MAADDIASGSGHSMALVVEATYGVTPAAPELIPVRHVSTTLGLTKQSFQSEELRSDRQIADFRHGTRQVGGDIVVELSAGSSDNLFEAALGGAWTDDVLKAGVLRRSFSVERNFADITQYLRYTGCEIDGFSLQVQPSGIVRVTFPVIGQDQNSGVAIIAGATYAEPTTSSPFDGFSGAVKEGDTEIAVVTDIQLQLQNGLQALFVVGSNKTRKPSIGRSNLTGTATMYFQDRVMLDKFVNETESSLEFTLDDGTDSLNFKVPRLKYSGGKPDVSGEGPITLAMPFQALLDSVSGSNLIITRTGE